MGANSKWLCAVGLFAIVAVSGGAGVEDRVTADQHFGDWRMECAITAGAARKGCAIWVGPISARRISGDPINFTLFVDPVTAFASVVTRRALFVQFKVDRAGGFFADCDRLGVCEVSSANAGSLFQEMYDGEKLLIRIAETEGTYDRMLDLSGYKSALDTYLAEERTYELKVSH
jgi:hypothetical protein